MGDRDDTVPGVKEYFREIFMWPFVDLGQHL